MVCFSVHLTKLNVRNNTKDKKDSLISKTIEITSRKITRVQKVKIPRYEKDVSK